MYFGFRQLATEQDRLLATGLKGGARSPLCTKVSNGTPKSCTSCQCSPGVTPALKI